MTSDPTSILQHVQDGLKLALGALSLIGVVWGAARWYTNKETAIMTWADRIEHNHITHIEAAVEETSKKLDTTNHLLEKGLDGIIAEIRVLSERVKKD